MKSSEIYVSLRLFESDFTSFQATWEVTFFFFSFSLHLIEENSLAVPPRSAWSFFSVSMMQQVFRQDTDCCSYFVEGDLITAQVNHIHYFQFRAHQELLSEFWLHEVTGLFSLHLPCLCQSNSWLGQELTVLWDIALQDFFWGYWHALSQWSSSLCSHFYFYAVRGGSFWIWSLKWKG